MGQGRDRALYGNLAPDDEPSMAEFVVLEDIEAAGWPEREYPPPVPGTPGSASDPGFAAGASENQSGWRLWEDEPAMERPCSIPGQ